MWRWMGWLRQRSSATGLAFLVAVVVGCSDASIGDGPPAGDSGTSVAPDAEPPLEPDGAAPPVDAAVPPVDARPPCVEGNARVQDENTGTCYIFFLGDADVLPWNEARTECAALGGDLAVLTSADENRLVSQIALPRDIWMGATDEGRAINDFVWVTGEGFDFVNWRSDEPNNGGGGEDCAILDAPNTDADGYEWDDRSCGNNLAYLCERP